MTKYKNNTIYFSWIDVLKWTFVPFVTFIVFGMLLGRIYFENYAILERTSEYLPRVLFASFVSLVVGVSQAFILPVKRQYQFGWSWRTVLGVGLAYWAISFADESLSPPYPSGTEDQFYAYIAVLIVLSVPLTLLQSMYLRTIVTEHNIDMGQSNAWPLQHKMVWRWWLPNTLGTLILGLTSIIGTQAIVVGLLVYGLVLGLTLRHIFTPHGTKPVPVSSTIQ